MKNTIEGMKALVIGCGSIGSRHLHNLKQIGFSNIAIYDSDKQKVDGLAKQYAVKKFDNLDVALNTFEPNFSVICTYPNSHMDLTSKCVDANSHVFIEKPISSDLNGVETMMKKADKKKLKIAVGYNLRFDPGLELLKKNIKKNKTFPPMSILTEWGHNIKWWRPSTNFKNHYILQKGSGIILDDSHEYDYVRWLLDDEVESVYCQTRKAKTIKTQTESIAAIVMKFKKGTIATFVIDYMRPYYERRCHIIGENGDLKWEFMPKSGSWKEYGAKANSTVITRFTNHNKTKIENFDVKLNYMYINEMHDFVNSIIGNRKPHVDGWEGIKTLKIGLAALLSSKTGKIIKL
jgi:predicted dehydrogenase